MAAATLSHAEFSNTGDAHNGEDLAASREMVGGSNVSNPSNGAGVYAASVSVTLPEGFSQTPVVASLLSEAVATRQLAEMQFRGVFMLLGAFLFSVTIAKVYL